METYQIYQHGRVIVAYIKANSHLDAARQFFKDNLKVDFCSVGRKGTAPEWQFKRGGGPVKVSWR